MFICEVDSVVVRNESWSDCSLQAVVRLHSSCSQSRLVLRDRADYWLSSTSARFRSMKKAIAFSYRLTDYLFGTVPAVNLDVAIRKGIGSETSGNAVNP